DDLEAPLPSSHAHLDLERVSVRPDFREIDRLEDLSPKALEPAGSVPHRETGNEPRIDVREVTEEQPADRPVDHAYPPFAISGAEDQVGTLDRPQEILKMRRVV